MKGIVSSNKDGGIVLHCDWSSIAELLRLRFNINQDNFKAERLYLGEVKVSDVLRMGWHIWIVQQVDCPQSRIATFQVKGSVCRSEFRLGRTRLMRLAIVDQANRCADGNAAQYTRQFASQFSKHHLRLL